jgi:hypothetical protein
MTESLKHDRAVVSTTTCKPQASKATGTLEVDTDTDEACE